MFDYDTKEKEHQNTRQSDLYSGATPRRTNQIASSFDALSITYFACIQIINNDIRVVKISMFVLSNLPEHLF
jgi:hypothetical protein